MKTFVTAILLIFLFGWPGNFKSAAASNRFVIDDSIEYFNYVQLIKPKNVLPLEYYARIQEYLRQTDKDRLIVKSPPDNMLVVVPNTSKYDMPATIMPGSSKYKRPTVRPHKK